jgi:hypothetical protein
MLLSKSEAQPCYITASATPSFRMGVRFCSVVQGDGEWSATASALEQQPETEAERGLPPGDRPQVLQGGWGNDEPKGRPRNQGGNGGDVYVSHQRVTVTGSCAIISLLYAVGTC